MVMVELTPHQAGDIAEQHRLMTNLQEHSGDKDKANVPVIATVKGGQRRFTVRLGRQFWVQDHNTAVEALNSAGFPARVQPLITV
jgi:DNA polymerase-3 subunit alpha